MKNLRILQIIVSCLKILPKKDRRKYWIILFIQASLGILDLIGVSLLGVVGALSIRGIQSQPPGDRVTRILEILRVNDLHFQSQVTLLVSIALLFLILKTILTVFWTRRILYFLGNKGAQISSRLLSKVLSQSMLAMRENSTQEIQYAVGLGVSAITVGVLGVGSTLFADLSLLIIIGTGLAFIDFYMALSSLILFGIVGSILYFSLHKRAREIGLRISLLNIESSRMIQEVIRMYREVYVKNRRSHYLRRIIELKGEHSKIFAEQTFLPNISKYVIEISMVIGIFTMAATQFLLHDASRAAASMAIFIAAASRIAPAILRLQQSLVLMQGNFGSAVPTFALIEKTKFTSLLQDTKDEFLVSYPNFSPEISLHNVKFKFKSENLFEINIPKLEINAGETIAIVGSSGSGKTTLVDLILGLFEPEEGEILISGLRPSEAISQWPGAVAYVPQQVTMSDSNLLENITIGYPMESVDIEAVDAAIAKTYLQDVISGLPLGLLSGLGEDGLKLSGGQRQRVGIARALLSNPKLLILDEATSSLDGQSEMKIGRAINQLRESVTVIHVAHRLSTVKDADRVIYLDKGEIKAIGTFDEVRKAIPDFDSQASLMGL